VNSREVSYEEGESFMQENNISFFFETSALNGQNVETVSFNSIFQFLNISQRLLLKQLNSHSLDILKIDWKTTLPRLKNQKDSLSEKMLLKNPKSQVAVNYSRRKRKEN